MANKKNGKKAPKKAHPFWARLWSGFRYWLQTLWSNGACLLARGKPWWASLPVVILSIIIAIIPTAVAMGNVSASSFITGQDLGLVAPTAAFVRDMEEKGILLSIDKDGILSDENGSWEKAYGANDLGAYYHTVVREVPKLPVETDSSSSQVIGSKPELVEETIVDFAVYYDYDGLYPSVTDFYEFVVTDENSKDPNGEDAYSVNSLFLDSDGFILTIMPNLVDSDGQKAETSIRYYWDSDEFKGKTLVSLLTPTFEGEAPLPDSYEYREASRQAWGRFLDLAYASTKWNAGWTNVGIIAAIVTGTIFIMGLIVFLATRGKNNPYRPLNFWDAQQAVYFESFTCAVIAMILGFIFGGSNYVMGMTIFMMVLAVRVIYTIFKTMRGPIAQG